MENKKMRGHNDTLSLLNLNWAFNQICKFKKIYNYGGFL